MPASLNALSLPFFSPHGNGYFNGIHSAGGPSEQHSRPTVQAVNSCDLLQGHKSVAITHNGTIYRLQATRLGKLILTK
jgi:hemin uptake protein HemP